jgi:hypothetical protein
VESAPRTAITAVCRTRRRFHEGCQPRILSAAEAQGAAICSARRNPRQRGPLDAEP